MKAFSLIFSVIFITAVVSCAQTMSREEWMKQITSRSIPGNHAGKFSSAQAGLALYFSPAGDINVPYLVCVPKKYDPKKPASVVVFLHGAILARDSFQYKESSIADEPIFTVADKYNVLVVFPFARADFAWGRNEKADEHIIDIIGQVEQTYNTDKKNVYIGGISMGGNATYWFVNHKADVFAGFYAFSSLPEEGSVQFGNINEGRPLYTANAKDDQVFAYSQMEELFNRNRARVPAWHFVSVETGGHRFIYGKDGTKIMQGLLGNLLHETPSQH